MSNAISLVRGGAEQRATPEEAAAAAGGKRVTVFYIPYTGSPQRVFMPPGTTVGSLAAHFSVDTSKNQFTISGVAVGLDTEIPDQAYCFMVPKPKNG